MRDGIVGRGLGLVELFPKIRVAYQTDFGGTAPFSELKCTCPHRVFHDPIAVGLDHLARDDPEDPGVGEDV